MELISAKAEVEHSGTSSEGGAALAAAMTVIVDIALIMIRKRYGS